MIIVALKLGANKTKLNNFLNSTAPMTYIQKDTNMGLEAGVKGTPTFIIGNKMLVGAQSYEEFQKLIDSQL